MKRYSIEYIIEADGKLESCVIEDSESGKYYRISGDRAERYITAISDKREPLESAINRSILFRRLRRVTEDKLGKYIPKRDSLEEVTEDKLSYVIDNSELLNNKRVKIISLIAILILSMSVIGVALILGVDEISHLYRGV